MLAEWPPSAGLLLFQLLRETRLWAGAEPGERRDLFSRSGTDRHASITAAHGLPPALHAPLAALADLLGSPAVADPAGVAHACTGIARGAAAAGSGATAVAFAETAALACPGSPEVALRLGELALRMGDDFRAEFWLRHAARLARGPAWATVYARAEIHLGRLRAARADPRGAQHHLRKALRTATRHALRSLRGLAALALFRLASAAGNEEAADAFARIAARCISPRDREFASARLAVAEHTLTRDAPRAAALLRDTLRHRLSHDDRIATTALLARAALAGGDPPAADRAWAGAVSLVVEHGESDETARRLLSLARAMLGFMEGRQLFDVVEKAAQIARRRGQAREASEAESLLRGALTHHLARP